MTKYLIEYVQIVLRGFDVLNIRTDAFKMDMKKNPPLESEKSLKKEHIKNLEESIPQSTPTSGSFNPSEN